MKRRMAEDGRGSTMGLMVTGSLVALLWHLLWNVEDGQFEREYSRLFAAVVLGGALLALLVAGTLVSLLLRLLSRKERGS